MMNVVTPAQEINIVDEQTARESLERVSSRFSPDVYFVLFLRSPTHSPVKIHSSDL